MSKHAAGNPACSSKRRKTRKAPLVARSLRFRSVRSKLITSFLAVAAVVAVVGLFGMTQQSSIGAKGKAIYNGSFTPLASIADAREAMLQSRFDLVVAGTQSGQSVEQSLSAWGDEAKTADDALAAFERANGDGSSVEKTLFSTISSNWSRYKDIAQSKAFPLLRANDAAAFDALRTSQIAPLFSNISDGFDKLVQTQDTQAKGAMASAESTQSSAGTLTVVLIVLGVGLAAGLGVVIAGGIARPLGASVASLDALAAKDLTKGLEVGTADETARMAASLNAAVDNLRGALGAIAQNSETLASASEELMAVSTQMGSNAEETSAQSGVVSAASEQVSRSVESVATAVEEMTASIREIAQNASDAAGVAAEAVEKASVTNANVTKLGESSVEIGNVVKVITSIAEQTNLLALNATIEAARAGESGKGFAVVANEVKELANETSRATEDISRRIEAIQGDTQEAVVSIQEITEVINRINDIQNTIASAVEEQAATTNEIGRNVSEAAKGTSEIAQNITGVAQAAHSTADGVGSTQQAATELSRMAQELNALVGEFTY
jgi:methyl-accepting chemotaxis protein